MRNLLHNREDNSMKKRIACLAAIMLLLSACKSEEKITGNETASDSTSAADSAVSEPKTDVPPKPVAPLSASKKQAYFQNEDFSVTAELKKLQSSLYYPDIVAKMGGNDELFAVEVFVKIKNLAYEDRSFDCSGLSLLSGGSGLYLFDTECEQAENIPSGKTVSFSVKFLCSISQAADISGMTFSGGNFEIPESFIPEKFAEVIETQSAEDVKEYLYRPYAIHKRADHQSLMAVSPAAIEACFIGKAGDDREYFAIKYMAYNRSDYALLLEPKAFDFYYLADGANERQKAEKVYISTDEDLMYQPVKADEKLKGIGTLYEVPEFLCMNTEGVTEFTIVYKAEGRIKEWMLAHHGDHNEPYYGIYESVYICECDYE